MITKSHDITEERMMDAVCMAVDESGFENLTTKLWAKKANVSEGSLYYHFLDKQDLLERTFYRIDGFFVQELKKIFADSAGCRSAEKKAAQIINTYLAYLCSHPAETYYYQAFCRTKLYRKKSRKEQLKNWAEMNEVFSSYQLKKTETVIALQFFFSETVMSYAEDLCSFETDMPAENFEHIKKLLIFILMNILEEKTKA